MRHDDCIEAKALALVLMVTVFVGCLDRINININFALPLMALEYGWGEAVTQRYGSLLMGQFGWRAGFLLLAAAGALISLPLVIACMTAAVFLFSAFTATEFALVRY